MSVYETGLSMEMIARHRLVDASPEESTEHSHRYVVEVTVRGEELDRHGYLVDIAALRSALASAGERFRDRCLNELEEFEGTAPSLENLARIIWTRVWKDLDGSPARTLSVKVWESEDAWAGYERGRER